MIDESLAIPHHLCPPAHYSISHSFSHVKCATKKSFDSFHISILLTPFSTNWEPFQSKQIKLSSEISQEVYYLKSAARIARQISLKTEKKWNDFLFFIISFQEAYYLNKYQVLEVSVEPILVFLDRKSLADLKVWKSIRFWTRVGDS